MPAHAVNQLRFVAVDQGDPLAEPLLAELALEYANRYRAPVEAMAKWLRTYPVAEFAAPGGAMLIGLCDAHPVTGGAFRRFDAQTAELKRIWTDSRYRRQGYAKEAVAALFDWAYRTHGIERFVASISPTNEPSLGLASQFGFVQVGEQMDDIDGLELVFETTWPQSTSR